LLDSLLQENQNGRISEQKINKKKQKKK